MGLDQNCLYGPIGMVLNNSIITQTIPLGEIFNSDKDGKNLTKNGQFNQKFPQVGTFDCQCLIVHSSLIQKHKLRFDENLSFDLYLEDFCIHSYEKYQIPSKILQLKCQHWSYGKVEKRFFDQYEYIQKKYKTAKNVYVSTCSKKLIGGNFWQRFYIFVMRSVLRFCFSKKQKKDGSIIIKICKIPFKIRRPSA